MLGNGSHDVQQEAVRLGHIRCGNIDTRFKQVGDEGDVARQTIKLGDEQDSPNPFRFGKRAGELRAVVLLAALNLDELGNDLTLTHNVVKDSLALRFKPQTAFPLPISADTKVGNETHGGLKKLGSSVCINTLRW